MAPANKIADQHFEDALWPHLAAAYNFARWMVRNPQDAEDIVQESFVKAFRSTNTLRGSDPRPWLFAIVRNNALNFLRRRKQQSLSDTPEPIDTRPDPEASAARSSRIQEVRSAIACLPEEFREALLLREMEGLAYKEIAHVLQVPLGTVMSRLSRARALLVEYLIPEKGDAR